MGGQWHIRSLPSLRLHFELVDYTDYEDIIIYLLFFLSSIP